jgi:RsiW-degrading membrane proteinase PrsW (M82 family)
VIAAPAAANPHYGRPPRVVFGLGILIGTLAAITITSVLDIRLEGAASAGLIDLIALILVLLVGAATFGLVRGFDHRHPDRHRRHRRVAYGVLGAVFVLLALLADLLFINLAVGALVACLPTTLFGLWLVRRLDRNEKEPWRLIFAAFGWGAVVATNLAVLTNSVYSALVRDALIPGPGQAVFTSFSASFREEVGKGAALLLLFLLMRDEFDDVVDGVVYGAAVGLGFNLLESASYIAQYGGLQWVNRQVLGLFAGHTIYTAMTGAGIGISRQLRSPLGRLAMIACGFSIAIGSHFAWDAWADALTSESGLGATVLLPTLLIEGPLLVAAVILVVLGLRREGRALGRVLGIEAARGTGAVLPDEVHVLTRPWHRFGRRLAVLFRRGPAAYVRVARLQRLQLDLAMELWHRERAEIDEPLSAEQDLRQRALVMRARAFGVPAPA